MWSRNIPTSVEGRPLAGRPSWRAVVSAPGGYATATTGPFQPRSRVYSTQSGSIYGNSASSDGTLAWTSQSITGPDQVRAPPTFSSVAAVIAPFSRNGSAVAGAI